MSPLRTFPTFNLALCLTLALSTALSPSLCEAQQAAAAPAVAAATPADDEVLHYVTPGACVVVTMRPAQLFNAPAAEMFPNEVLQAAFQSPTGIDPLAVEELVISWSPPSNYAVYVRTTDTIALKHGPVTDHTSPGTLNGKEYLKSSNHLEPSYYSPDERSLLAGPDFIVKQLVEDSDAKHPDILKNFTDETAQDDFHLAINVAMLRPVIAMAMWNAKLPPEFAAVRDVPGMISHIDLRFNISHAAPTELVVTANHAADANRLESTVETLKHNVLAQLDREAAKEFDGEEPVQAATRAYQRRVNQKLSDSLHLERRDNQLVVFRTEAPTSKNGDVLSVATIGVLVALLLPAVQAARAAARRNAAINNMKQINLALLNYESAHGEFPAAASFGENGEPLLSWRVHVLPYMDQNELYEQFHLDEPWDSEHNKSLIAKMPPAFRDAASKASPNDGKTNYLGIIGEGMFFDPNGESRKVDNIADGSSQTMALLQVDDDHAAVWTEPVDWTPEDEAPLNGLGGLHTNALIASYCDGSVDVLSVGVEPNLFKSFLTIDADD